MIVESKPFISEGDIVTNHKGESVTISSVERTRYGLLLKGVLRSGYSFMDFLPYELSPQEIEYDWYGWSVRGYITLSNGIKLGDVSFWRSDPRPFTPEEFDKEWERTLEAMREAE